MQIVYNDRTDLLYIRLDDQKRQVINKRLPSLRDFGSLKSGRH